MVAIEKRYQVRYGRCDHIHWWHDRVDHVRTQQYLGESLNEVAKAAASEFYRAGMFDDPEVLKDGTLQLHISEDGWKTYLVVYIQFVTPPVFSIAL